MEKRESKAKRSAKQPPLVARVESKHIKDCAALRSVTEGWWGTPWAAVARDGERITAWLSRRGLPSPKSGTLWVRLICNDTRCPATAVVNATAIATLAPHGVASSRVAPLSRR